MATLPQPQLPQARVCHFANGRLRVKIPERRHDEAFFDTVRERLSSWASIERVEVNPLTASVLVRFADLTALFAENALKNDLFEVDYDALSAATEPQPPLTERAAQGFARVDAALQRWSGGAADFRSVVFLLLLLGGLRQLSRGNIASPAASLLFKSGDLLGLWYPPPAARSAGGGGAPGEG
jgi:hypothetical protein